VKDLAKFLTSKPGLGAAMAFKDAYELINPHLYTVEERIRQQARTFDPALEGYVSYALNSGGKRLRPALALLVGGATGKISQGHVDLAVIVELIHLATLVHDDIMDGAELRREQPTANAKWGNALSVLLGDCLFSHALKLSTAFSNNEISRRIAEAATDVCSGEIIQTQRRYDLNLGTADYYRIIEMKTAALFAVAGELAAYISESSPENITAMKTFGLKLGTAYQIYDDCLDIAGDEERAGKTLGTDLRKGKFTLPVLLLLQKSSPAEREQINEMILQEDGARHAELADWLNRSGSMSAAIATGKKILDEATAALESVSRNRYAKGLGAVTAYLGSQLDSFDS